MAFITSEITPPTVISEDWLNKVLTIDNTGDAGSTGHMLVDTEGNGKISNRWLNRYPETVTNLVVTVNANTKVLERSLLGKFYGDNTGPILALDSNNELPGNLQSTSTPTVDRIVRTGLNTSKLDNLWLNGTVTKTPREEDYKNDTNRVIFTTTSGYLSNTLLNIQRIKRMIKENISSSTEYSITSASQNNNPTEGSLTIPSNHDLLFVYVNGILNAEGTGYDYIINDNKFTFFNGLSKEDVLQFVAIN